MQLAAVILLSCLPSWQAPKAGVIDPRAGDRLLWFRAVAQRAESAARSDGAGAARRRPQEGVGTGTPGARRATARSPAARAGKALVDDLRKATGSPLPDIAAKAGVQPVVPEVPPGVEAVDVTPLLLDAPGIGEAARRRIERVQQSPRRPPPGHAGRKGTP